MTVSQTKAQQGWQCPICLSIYSPIIPICSTCSKPVETHQVNAVDPKTQALIGAITCKDCGTVGPHVCLWRSK